MFWEKPYYNDIRLGFEVTTYILNRWLTHQSLWCDILNSGFFHFSSYIIQLSEYLDISHTKFLTNLTKNDILLLWLNWGEWWLNTNLLWLKDETQWSENTDWIMKYLIPWLWIVKNPRFQLNKENTFTVNFFMSIKNTNHYVFVGM